MITNSGVSTEIAKGSVVVFDAVTLTVKRGRIIRFPGGIGVGGILTPITDTVRWTSAPVPLRVYAARAEKVLKLYTPVGFTQALVPANPVIAHFTSDQDANLRMGRVSFRATEADGTPLNKLPRPVITPNDGQGNGGGHPQTVTIMCPGATAIYYTLDYSHPWAGNPTAVLYSAPFSMTTAGMVRARGFAAGAQFIGSDTAAVAFA